MRVLNSYEIVMIRLRICEAYGTGRHKGVTGKWQTRIK